MNSKIRSILFGNPGAATLTGDVGVLLFRVFVGLGLAFGHGMGKLPPSPGFIETTASLGFPFPTLFAWAAAFAEFGGGLLIALGLLTRPASLFVAFTMAVAAFGQHAGDGFGEMEKPLLYLVAAVLLMLIGAGRYSIDRLIHKERDDRIWR